MTAFDWSHFAQRAAQAHLQVELSKPMASHTTYGVGGSAACAITVSNRRDLQVVADLVATSEKFPLAVVGRGSNLLIADDGFDGLIVLMAYSPDNDVLDVVHDDVVAPASMPMPILARRSVAAGRAGLEWCVGIPGTVGGAVRMNAGGHGSEIVDDLVSAEIVSLMSGKWVTVDSIDLGLHFRGSALAQHHVVVSVRLRTEAAIGNESAEALDRVVSWRREHQPGGRNAGSVFVNPAPGEGSSGALIDASGLRGLTIGGAQVSEKHANFIQATDSARATDIVAVMRHVQEVVERDHGVRLHSEVCLLGFGDEVSLQFADARHHDALREINCVRLAEIMGDPQ